MQTERIAVGIVCSGTAENNPILIDQCALYALPTENLLLSGTMETTLKDDQMPLWYWNGKSVSPTADGYQSNHGLELPLLRDRVSSLACLIVSSEELAGRAVWISAMTKSVPEGNAPPPEVTLVLRLTDADGKQSRISTPCPATRQWAETTLLATMPEYAGGDETDVPPFQVLLFERPPGVGGRVIIDDVAVLAIPEGPFDGAVAAGVPSD